MRKKKVVEGIVIPKRYQDKRRAEKQIRDLKLQQLKEQRPKSDAIRIPFRLDDWNKSVVMRIKENRLDKYPIILELLGSQENINTYVNWFKSGYKTEEQLTCLHLRDYRKIIDNDNSNNSK
jgi:hypothetical protein